MPRWFRIYVLVFSVSQGIVFIEPSPSDVLALGLILICLVFGWIGLSAGTALPVALLVVHVASSSIPFLYVVDIERSVFYHLVTIYLVISMLAVHFVVSRFGFPVIRCILQGYVLIAIATAFASLLSLAGVLPSFGVLTYWGVRASGLFKDPNTFGAFLVMSLLVCMFSFKEVASSRFPAWIQYGVCATLLAGLVSSGSRAAWLNLGLATVVAAAFSLRRAATLSRRYRFWILTIVASAIIASVIAVFLATASGGFMDSRLRLQAYDAERFGAQQASLAYALRNPFGIGPGQTESTRGTASIFNDRGPVSTHSLYIRALVEAGWLGAASLMLFIVVTLLRGIRAALFSPGYPPSCFVIYSALVGTLANGAFIDTIHWRHFWLQVGIVLGLYTCLRRERRHRTREAGQDSQLPRDRQAGTRLPASSYLG